MEAVAVLDVGKTHAKLSIVTSRGEILASHLRPNAVRIAEGRPVLDSEGVEAWLLATLREAPRELDLAAIIPVGHGAAAALICDGKLAAPVLDYEAVPPAKIASLYDTERDPFEATLSPRLAACLNLGTQLFWQEHLLPELWPLRAHALFWPQYWAWTLCGVEAAEITSLGCHTDLWRPLERDYSHLAKSHGWTDRFPSIHHAGATLGRIRPKVASSTGVSAACEVLCGVHDSNAALLAMRGIAGIDSGPLAVVSTGTWFVAMQAGVQDVPALDEKRDTLANVDVDGCCVPSARFMGGREYTAILGELLGAIASEQAVIEIVARGLSTTPSFAGGSGPYPHGSGEIIGSPDTDEELATLASLHLALMLDASLDLLSARGPIVIEGRFADDPVFPRAVAALRPLEPVFKCRVADSLALGAARLRFPGLALVDAIVPVEPLNAELTSYRDCWRDRAASTPRS